MKKIILILFLFSSEIARAGSQKELKDHLDYLTAREMVLSQNLANLDTPNYRPKDLEKQSKGSAFSLARSHPGHIGLDEGDKYRLVEGEISEIKPNGNAVTAEKELSKKNENAINFSQTSSNLASFNRMMRLATKGGN